MCLGGDRAARADIVGGGKGRREGKKGGGRGKKGEEKRKKGKGRREGGGKERGVMNN